MKKFSYIYSVGFLQHYKDIIVIVPGFYNIIDQINSPLITTMSSSKSKFGIVNLSNGDFFAEMLFSDISYLLLNGMLKKDYDAYVVARVSDIPYLTKFYSI